MEEQRKYYRLKKKDLISFAVIPNYKSERLLTLDLSVGGLRFISQRFISPESILKVELAFKGVKKSINAIVKAKWTKAIFSDERYEIGAEFVNIRPEDLRFLKRYLK